MNLTGQQTRGKSESRFETTPGGAKPTQQTTMPPSRTWLWLLGVLLANYFLARLLMPSPEAPITVPYTFFKEEVGKGNVEAIYSQGESITGRFKAAVSYPPPGQKSAPPSGTRQSADKTGAAPSDDTQTNTDATVATNSVVKTSRNFATTLPTFVGPSLEAFLIDHGVEISAKPIEEGGSSLFTFLFGFGPALLFIGFYVWMFRRMAKQGGGMGAGLFGIGKSTARRYDQEKDTKVTFDDVAGITKPKTS